jgi:hypothetical protein
MKTALLLLAAALISAPAAAHEPVVAVGVRTNSCSEFTALIHHSKRQADNLYYSWAEGFWSLANMGRMANKNKFKDLITAPQARQPGSEIAAEPGSKLSDQAVTPSAPTSIAIREFPELQQQLQTIVSDLAALQRIVEQVASKQEQISRDVATLQTTEQNISGKVSSLTQPTAVRVVQRRNVAKLVHLGSPKQPAAESLPVQTPAPETPSPVDQPPRPPLPLSTPPEEAPSPAH